MTKDVISTSDINVFIKKAYPSLYLSVEDLKAMGFEPAFRTSHGTYWDPAVVEGVEAKLKAIQDKPLKPMKNDDSYKKGYQDGYKARSKKEWRGITLDEADTIVQESMKVEEYVLDYGYIIEACEKLLRAKNHG